MPVLRCAWQTIFAHGNRVAPPGPALGGAWLGGDGALARSGDQHAQPQPQREQPERGGDHRRQVETGAGQRTRRGGPGRTVRARPAWRPRGPSSRTRRARWRGPRGTLPSAWPDRPHRSSRRLRHPMKSHCRLRTQFRRPPPMTRSGRRRPARAGRSALARRPALAPTLVWRPRARAEPPPSASRDARPATSLAASRAAWPASPSSADPVLCRSRSRLRSRLRPPGSCPATPRRRGPACRRRCRSGQSRLPPLRPAATGRAPAARRARVARAARGRPGAGRLERAVRLAERRQQLGSEPLGRRRTGCADRPGAAPALSANSSHAGQVSRCDAIERRSRMPVSAFDIAARISSQ